MINQSLKPKTFRLESLVTGGECVRHPTLLIQKEEREEKVTLSKFILQVYPHA